MSFIRRSLTKLIGNNLKTIIPQVGSFPQCMQTKLKHYQIPYEGKKNYWPKFMMMRDQRRRMVYKEYGPYYLRYRLLRLGARILPQGFKEDAVREVKTLPSRCNWPNLQFCCRITSKRRGVVLRHGLSRFMFRHLADYNQMAGVQRARWG